MAVPDDWKEIEIVIDTREPGDMVKEFISILGIDRVKIKQLESSDYNSGIVGFERKKDDIVNLGDVVTKSRELKSNFPKAILIIEHSLDETIRLCASRGIHRNSVIGMIGSLIASDIYPVFAGKKRNLVDLVIAISSKCNDGKDRGVETINPLRPQAKERDYALRAVRGFGLGDKTARLMLEYYNSPSRLIEAIYCWPMIDDRTKKLAGLGGQDAQMEKALKALESRWAKEKKKKRRGGW